MNAIESTALVSLASWFVAPSLIISGWLSERYGRKDLTMHAFFLGAAAMVLLIPLIGASAVLFIVIGLLFGPAAPIIMTLPVQFLEPRNRAMGMGLYFTCYYIGMAVAPPLVGVLLDYSSNAATPLWFASAVMVATTLTLFALRFLQQKTSPLARSV